MSGSLCVLRYYTINRRGRSNTIKRGKTVSFLIFLNLEKRIQKGCKYNKLKFTNPTQKGGIFILLCIVLAAWPSGKAGDCKSFFPSSNPGAASSTNESKSLILFRYFFMFWGFCKRLEIFESKIQRKIIMVEARLPDSLLLLM